MHFHYLVGAKKNNSHGKPYKLLQNFSCQRYLQIGQVAWILILSQQKLQKDQR